MPGLNESGPKRRRKAPWIIGIVVVVLLAAGGGAWLWLNRSGSAGSADGGSAMPGKVAAQAWSTSGKSDALVGVWATRSTIVRIGMDGVVGYDLNSGKQLFTTPPPKAGLKPCSASATLSTSGAGSVFYSEDGNFDCNTVAAIDATSGKMLWHDNANTSGIGSGSTFISGSVVVAASDNGVVAGLDVQSGNSVWNYRTTAANCQPYATAGMGSIVIVQETCLASGGKQPGSYVAVDAATGKHLWQAPTEDGFYLRSVISTSPVVLLASSKTVAPPSGTKLNDGSHFLVFNSAGQQTASIPADDNQAGATLRNPIPTALVAGNALFENTTGTKVSEGTQAGTIVTAYSLASGSKLGSFAPEVNGIEVSTWLVGETPDGKAPLVLEWGSQIGDNSPVLELDPTKGTPSVLYAIPSKVDSEESFVLSLPNGNIAFVPKNNPPTAPAISVYHP